MSETSSSQHSYAEVLFGALERLQDVTTPKALANWVETELRAIFPFGACVIALGRVHPDISLSPICSTPAFPESLLRSFRVLTDGSAIPLLQSWLSQQKALLLDLTATYAGFAPLWLNVLRQHGYRQTAMQASYDLRGRRLVYVCFLDVGIKNPEATRRILNIMMPHIAQAVGQVYRSMRRKQLAADSTAEVTLSLREREVLKWIREGKTNREISDIMGLSFKTIKNHVENILEKLGVANRAEAVAKAVSQDFLESRLDLPTQGLQFHEATDDHDPNPKSV
ncbi:helix-turn-helix transcriptional regulator [Parvibium lacunae]|uniref:HTH luxR-type domain-containing protein n=1 Tax=Parvibium lacunae TaxID=1888893 RepID=A0A368L5S2_9BURK|nr:helix-turn-helix transcriptional regulator [Parvibium lacunae]RCS58490.1 hypothetical protein DU000_06685 [Parvibium lacunae]